MTWIETHERTRIIREVEAAAACDETGHLPWKDSWTPYFGDREALLTALRARWDRMCQVQLDTHPSESVLESYGRLRRTHAAVLRILEANPPAAPVPAPAPVQQPLQQQAQRALRIAG